MSQFSKVSQRAAAPLAAFPYWVVLRAMKKKIVLGLSLFALMFFFGGIYIITTTETTIYDLHRLSQLHRTIAIRKDLLLSIEKNQNYIILRDTNPFAESLPDDNGLADTFKKCLACHQTSSSGETIARLQQQIKRYLHLMSDIFATPSREAVSKPLVNEALKLGDDMIGKIEHIINATSDNFNRQEIDILRRIDKSKNILFMLVTVGPFFAIGLAFILIRGLTRPVKSLLDATRRLKAGDLDHRIRGLRGEFGEVANSYNEMVTSLKKQMEALQRTEQLRICGEMAAGLVHEIRNPLAGMKVSIEVLLAELKLEERDRDVLVKVVDQIKHVELLMKNLLNYARPAAAEPVSVNVNKILEKTVYFIEKHPSSVSGEAQRQVKKELDPHLPEIVADPQQLQQVFFNILLNSVDAIAEGGIITVVTRYDETLGAVVVEIRDTGKGIPAKLREKVFQPFFTTKGKGTGLGLAISKRIIDEHGGSIAVANQVSGGVAFMITLPLKPQDKGGAA
jgi:signal transduction histidine kinase